MTNTWYILMGVALGVVACYVFYRYFLKNNDSSQKQPLAGRNNLIESQAAQKVAHKQKIIQMLEGKNRITNNYIQKALDVSDATVTRYLDELQEEGYLRQVGLTGKDVYYDKK